MTNWTRSRRDAGRISATVAAILLVATAAATATAGAAGEPESDGPRVFVRGGYQAGWVPATHEFFDGTNDRGEPTNQSGEPIDAFQSIRLEVGWQTDGSRDWHHLYDFPAYGLGLYAADYDNDDELGKPTSIYGFFDWPLRRWRRSSLVFNVGFGIADNWQPYHPRSNPHNMVIGATQTVHIDLGLLWNLEVAPRWSVTTGVTGTHFSNGGSAQPNAGVNQVGPIAMVRYSGYPRFEPPPRREPGPYDRGWSLDVSLSGGVRNHQFDDGLSDPDNYYAEDYVMGNLALRAGKAFAPTQRWNLGVDLVYDGSMPDLIRWVAARRGEEASADGWDKLQLGLVGGWELVVHRTHFQLQAGYMVLRSTFEGQRPALYQRFGIKHHLHEHWFAGLNVRLTDFSRAYTLEWTVGARIRP
jgi:hypothetical protein